MADGTRLRELQEHKKQIDQMLKIEALKREAAEIKMQEQITKANEEMKGFMHGVGLMASSIQLQLSNLDKGKKMATESSILGSPNSGDHSKSNQPKPQHVIPNREWSDSELTEDYFIASFISGLGKKIQSLIQMFKPRTLSHAIELGQQQINNMETMSKKFKSNNKPNQFTAFDREGVDETYLEDVELATAIEEESIRSTYSDSGSTLSFINETTAKGLGCVLNSAKPLMVKVVNGHKMISSTRLKFCTPVELDYDKMTFTVTVSGKKVKIQAMTVEGQCNFNFILETALFEMELGLIQGRKIEHYINFKPPNPNAYPDFEICGEILRWVLHDWGQGSHIGGGIVTNKEEEEGFLAKSVSSTIELPFHSFDIPKLSSPMSHSTATSQIPIVHTSTTHSPSYAPSIDPVSPSPPTSSTDYYMPTNTTTTHAHIHRRSQRVTRAPSYLEDYVCSASLSSSGVLSS
ncbi:hypothetical protein C2S51_001240 [Perilla frutescens var. frutescens]|nr:hypothetical protein C2S51_001240 [Perilla frutescens var. frutescens]